MRGALAVLAVLVRSSLLVLDKQRPVTRVINLLKDMQKQLEKEAKDDQEVYDKVTCWCETNGKEKSKAVDVAEQRTAQLSSTIEELTAHSSELKTDIQKVKEDIAANQQALGKATAIREEESSQFTAEEKDMLQSITALKNAIVVLNKHHSLSQESMLDVQEVVDHLRAKHSDMLMGVISPSERQTLTGFLQQPGYQSYSSQSGEIFGILKQMQETFEANLTQSQKDELVAHESYSELKSAKQAEIQAGQDQWDNKSSELADVDEKNAQAKQDMEDTRNALTADQQFLMDLRKRCRETDAEFAERTQARQEEIQAVGETIGILSNDDAHDMFSKTLNFLETVSDRRKEAAMILRKAAQKSRNPELAALASTMQLDAFTKVKKAIDDMVAALQKEKQDEIKHRDWCNGEFNQNERQTTQGQRTKDDFEGKIADLTQTITTSGDDIQNLNAEVAEMRVQMKRASEDRAAENKEFQQTVSDQRATQQILQKALVRLQQVYANKEGFMQVGKEDPVPGAAAPPPPEGFKSYNKNAGAGGVMGMIQTIISDAKRMESEATKGEQDAQAAYEDFVKDSNAAIAQRSRDIVNKTEDKAQAEQDKSAADGGLKATMSELEQLNSYNGELHKSCDFVVKNFEIRQTARDQEVEALRQAKAILSGADFA